jgi:polyisoprenyl-teichoic acid--peptidoglycan teichoic acid transferase
MTRLKGIGIIFGGLLLILIVVGLAAYPRLKQQWETPLGPGLELPTLTLSPTATSTTEPQAEAFTKDKTPDNKTPTLATESIPTPTSIPTPQPLCGGPPVMYILAVGTDAGDNYLYGLSDVIRVARIDFITPKVTVLSMPRDLWVALPEGVGRPGSDPIANSKLNQAYFYGTPGMGYYAGPGAGPGLLARTLDLNFGLRADHYGAVNMQTFVKIVDAVDGIDIYLPTDVDGRPIDDKTQDMGYFQAGQQHFTGDQALRFARIRKKYNDFTRMDHQNMVMCSLRKKLVSASVLPKIPQIVNAFKDSILTDLSPEQIGQLVCLLPSVKRENLLFTGLPDEIMSPGRVYSPIQKSETFIMQADFDVIRSYIEQFQAGTWPNEPEEPTCP